MKRTIILGGFTWLFSSFFSFNAAAQTTDIVGEKDKPKETQEIIIRKKGDKDTKLTLEISGDKVVINGKPIAEFSEDGLTINNRKIIVRDGQNLSIHLDKLDGAMRRDMNNFERNLGGMTADDISEINVFSGEGSGISSLRSDSKPYVFLGVTTGDDIDGAKILSVIAESPADKAGLKKDDIITKINDKKIEASSLSDVIRSMKAGDKVKVHFKRDGKNKSENVTLAEKKVNTLSTIRITGKDGSVKMLSIPKPPMPPAPPGFEKNWENNFDGAVFQPRKPKLGLKIQDTEEGNGVKILDVETGSASATAGLLKDDIVTEIAGVKVENTDDAREQLQLNAAKNTYNIKAKRNGSIMSFDIKIPKKLKTANL